MVKHFHSLKKSARKPKTSNFVLNMNIPFQSLYLKHCITKKVKMKAWKNK